LAVATVVMSASPAVPKRRLGKLPTWAKQALKLVTHVAIDAILTCLAAEAKRLSPAVLKKIPGLNVISDKIVGKGIDLLKKLLMKQITKAVDGAIDKLRRNRGRLGFGSWFSGVVDSGVDQASETANALKKDAEKLARKAKEEAEKKAREVKA